MAKIQTDFGHFQIKRSGGMWDVMVAGIKVGTILRDASGACFSGYEWRILGDQRKQRHWKYNRVRAYGFPTAQSAAHEVARINSSIAIAAICRAETLD